jgi:hypothetical protein
MAQILVLGAPHEGCAGKHGRSIPLADLRENEGYTPQRGVHNGAHDPPCLLHFMCVRDLVEGEALSVLP